MRICFFTGDITASGGTERVVSTLTEELLSGNEQDQLYILSLEKGSSKPFFELHPKLILANLDLPEGLSGGAKFLQGVRRLRRFLKENSIDVFIDVDTLLSVYSVPAVSFLTTKHLSWEHFTFNQDLGVNYRNWGRKLAGRFADGIVVLTQHDQQQFQASPSIKRPVHHIYNPILLNETTLPEKEAKQPMIFSAGRLTDQKGFDLLIDVAEFVLKEHPDWTWVIAGEGEDREALEKKIQAKHLEEHVLLPGVVDNIEDYYQKAALFVLTSRFEPFGLVLTEAKAFHLPCVSFDVDSGPAEIILDTINGYLIEPFDIKAMAQKINYLIEHPEVRKQQGAKAMVDTEKFKIEHIGNKWEKLFEALV